LLLGSYSSYCNLLKCPTNPRPEFGKIEENVELLKLLLCSKIGTCLMIDAAGDRGYL
jgi:hypothetical protein